MTVDPGEYCRAVESYLCRQNEGHLIRIVGPSFELVCGWAERQIPLRVVHAGIDRTCERLHAKGTSRRPVRIEFCEADVLETFDEWRRAVGVTGPSGGTDRSPSRRLSLAAHIERVRERLETWAQLDQTGVAAPDVMTVVTELGSLQERARAARGHGRDAILARLREIEQRLLAAVRDRVDAQVFARLETEAAQELEPFRQRMPVAAFAEAKRAGLDRLLYDHAKLPRVAFE